MHYFLWKFKSELYGQGNIHLYWYSILLIFSFLIAIYLLRNSKLNSNKNIRLDWYVFCLLSISLIFARLGYTISNPVKVLPGDWVSWLVPFSFSPKFHFTGINEFSLPAGVIGLFVGIASLNKWMLKGNIDNVIFKTLIPALLVGALLFKANFIHGFYKGTSTDSPIGTVFIRPILDGLKSLPCCIMRSPNGPNPLETVTVFKDKKTSGLKTGQKNIVFNLVFKKSIEEREATEFIIGDVKTFLFEHPEYTIEPGDVPIKYALTKTPNGNIKATVNTIAIARHPVQLYYTISLFLLFCLLQYLFRKHKIVRFRFWNGLVLITFSILYIILEYITMQPENIKSIAGFNYNQWMTLSLVLLGVLFIFYPEKEKTQYR